MKKLIFSIFFSCFFFFISHGGFKEDSIKIVNQFNRALVQPQKADSIIASIQPKSIALRDLYHYHYAKYYFVTGQLAKVNDQVEKGIALAEKSNSYRRIAKYYNLRGSVQAMQGNYKEGVSEMVRAVKISEKLGDVKKAAQVKNNIANIFFSLRDYQSAYKYAKDAYTILKEYKDSTHLPAVTGVAAISALKIDSIDEGRRLTKEALDYAVRYSNPIGWIVGYHAQAEMLLFEQEYQEAIKAYEKSLSYSRRFQQSHYVMLNKIGLMNAYLNLRDYKQAVVYGEEALSESKSRENENTLYAIHKKLGVGYSGLSDYKNAYHHLNLAHDYFIKNANKENRSIINEMLIKYETEKKERLLAEKSIEVLKSEQEIDQRNNWITLLSLLFVVLILIVLYAYRIIRQRVTRLREIQEKRLLLASAEGEERERRRIANELHDGVASALTGAKIHLELLADTITRDELKSAIDQLTQTHSDVRRISHNLMPVEFEEQNLTEVLKNYCQENSTPKLKIQFNGSSPVEIDKNRARLVYRISQELVSNVQKHANASFCMVQLSVTDNELILSVEDNGEGFRTDRQNNNLGLKNIKRRIHELGGNFSIESELQKGVLVILEMPLT